MLDFSDVQAPSVLKGQRQAIVSKVEEGKAQSSGNPYLKVEFTITDKENTGMKISSFFSWIKSDGQVNEFAKQQFASLLDSSETDRKISSYQDIVGKKLTLNIKYNDRDFTSDIKGFAKAQEPAQEV